MTVFGWGWFFDRCVSARVHFFGPGSAVNCGICLELRVFYDEIPACQVFPDISGTAVGSEKESVFWEKTSNFFKLEGARRVKKDFSAQHKCFSPAVFLS